MIARGSVAHLALVACVTAVLVGTPAAAQVPGESVIDRRFDEALAALDAGDWHKACPMFREVLAAEATVAVLFKIAKCSEHEGKIAQAWRETREGLRINERTADAERRSALAEYGALMVRQLEPRLSRIAVKIEGGPTTRELSVKSDGAPLDPEGLGEPLVVDRGRHELTAEARGFERATETVEVGEGETKAIVLRLRRTPPAALPPKPKPVSPLLVLGGVVGSLGVASLGVAIGTGVRALDLGAELTARCPDPARCDATGVGLAADGALFAPLSTSFFVVGGALTAASIPLLVVGATSSRPAPVAVAISPTPGGLGVRVGGALP